MWDKYVWEIIPKDFFKSIYLIEIIDFCLVWKTFSSSFVAFSYSNEKKNIVIFVFYL